VKTDLPISTLPMAALGAAWLLPNHAYPWISAWQGGLVLALLVAAGLLGRHAARLPTVWALALALALGSMALQWGTGLILFHGDALVAALYVATFGLAIALGSTLAVRGPDGRTPALEWLAAGTLTAAVFSVGIALSQWTQTYVIHFTVSVDLKAGARPYANLSQANHFCTAAFLGLCSLVFLHEARRVGRLAFWVGAIFLLFGMVMSGSRTGWLQMAMVVTLALMLRQRVSMRLTAGHLMAILGLYALLTLAWPPLNDALYLSGGRGVGEQLEGGVRLPLWRSLLDAVGREPLWGYGWQQVTLAQQVVALDHPPVFHIFEHSHNLVLDLVLWAGIPMGGALALLIGLALLLQLRALRDARALWLMAAVLGVLTHSMLEYPIEFAYFLLPTGLCLGAAHALCPTAWSLPVRPVALRLWALMLTAVLGVVALDYLEAEQNHRLLRLESAHIGTLKIESKAPELRVLDQLQAFLWFARTEARPGMPAAERERMRMTAQRFAYPPLLLRQALIAGLHGDLEDARRQLSLICSLHSPQRCREGRESWQQLQMRYPQLQAVKAP
jgi:O-antigen ligase